MTLGLHGSTNHKGSSLPESVLMSTRSESNSKKGLVTSLVHEVSSSKSVGDLVVPAASPGILSCPCCKQDLKDDRQVVGVPSCKFYASIFDDDGSETESCTSFSDTDDEGSMMIGALSSETTYTITNNLFHGWIHKQGTGMDWIRSKAWKPRWAVLSLAIISGHEVPVPILEIFWNPSSSTPSTVIHLDSAVILPEDLENKAKWNAFRFQVRHVRKSVNENLVQAARLFTCKRDSRDAWCEAISTALLSYEKEKANARKHSGQLAMIPVQWQSANGWATGDTHPTTLRDFPPLLDLPASRRRSTPRDLPRHEPSSLIGECLLAACLMEQFE